MRIGLISDTHLPAGGRVLWPEVRQAFEGVDLILHAGDMYVLSVLDWLEEIAPVIAVRGNGDGLLPDDPRMEHSQIIEVEGHKIGMVHYLYFPGSPLEREMRRNFGGPVDIIVFGDSHEEYVAEHEGILLVNPGSPTFPHNRNVQRGTVAILDISTRKAEARIIDLKELYDAANGTT